MRWIVMDTPPKDVARLRTRPDWAEGQPVAYADGIKSGFFHRGDRRFVRVEGFPNKGRFIEPGTRDTIKLTAADESLKVVWYSVED